MSKTKLTIGDQFTEFELPNQRGELVRISPSDGKRRIIYFYPKDETRVCTAQACSFRDWQGELTDLGVEVIGISSDSPEAHLKFMANHNLNFILLSDKKGVVRKQFGASGFLGIPLRKTFLINKEGVVEYEYEAMFQGEGHVIELKKHINKQSK